MLPDAMLLLSSTRFSPRSTICLSLKGDSGRRIEYRSATFLGGASISCITFARTSDPRKNKGWLDFSNSGVEGLAVGTQGRLAVCKDSWRMLVGLLISCSASSSSF